MTTIFDEESLCQQKIWVKAIHRVIRKIIHHNPYAHPHQTEERQIENPAKG